MLPLSYYTNTRKINLNLGYLNSATSLQEAYREVETYAGDVMEMQKERDRKAR